MTKPFEHTVVRDIAVSPATAYAWLTDYREDDAQWLFADEHATRSFERQDSQTIRVTSVTRFSVIRSRIEMLVRLLPPDSWRAEGQVQYYGVRMLRTEVQWRVDERSPNGTRLSAKFRLVPDNIVARVLLAFSGARIRQSLEETYDRIARRLAAAPSALAASS